MHVLAEEIPKDGTLTLNAPFDKTDTTYKLSKLKYLNNAIHTVQY